MKMPAPEVRRPRRLRHPTGGRTRPTALARCGANAKALAARSHVGPGRALRVWAVGGMNLSEEHLQAEIRTRESDRTAAGAARTLNEIVCSSSQS